MADQKYGYHIN